MSFTPCLKCKTEKRKMSVYRLSTKELLAHSMEDLLKTQSIDSISVGKIAQNCGLTRQTFYNHFLDKYDLICWIFSRDMIVNMDMVDFETYTWEDATRDTNRVIREKYTYYREAIKDKGQNSLLTFALPKMQEEFLKVIRRRNPEFSPDEHFLFVLQFFISGYISSITSWILGKCSISPEDLAKDLISCMPVLIQDVLL